MGGETHILKVRIPAPYTGCNFLKLFCCKNCIDVLKGPKINKKRPGKASFLLITKLGDN